MRMTFRHIITAAASILTLFSCAKNLPVVEPQTPGTGEDSGRVITASFSDATKTQPGGTNGLTPQFNDGDLIKVSNGTDEPQICTVRVNGGGSGRVAFFRTTLTGPLKAVYPADAAVLSGNAITGVSVPTTTDGSFAKANIAMAENITAEARFHNQTPILRFYVDASIGVKSITITSTENIATGSKTITVDAGTSTLDQITDDPEKRLCYVPVLESVNTHHMTFESETTGQGQGTVTKTMTADNTLQEGKMYNIFIPYYIDLGTAGKWAYCNIGAFLPEDAGKYFAWGAVAGYGWTGSKFEENHNFSEGNAPYRSGSSYSKYNTADGKTVLDPEDDAAHVLWGDAWRMPTGVELKTMWESGCMAWENTSNKKGYYYFVTGDVGLSADRHPLSEVPEAKRSLSKLYFPAAGASNGTGLGDGGICHYWSGTRIATDNDNAVYIKAIAGSGTPYNITDNFSRFKGRSIRPIYDGSLEVEIEEYNDPIDI